MLNSLKKLTCLAVIIAMIISCFGMTAVFADNTDNAAGFTIDGVSIADAIAGGTITQESILTYTGAVSPVSGKLILAAYKKDKFIALSVADVEANSAPTATLALSELGELPTTAAEWRAYSVKAMIWDSLDTIKPVAELVQAEFRAPSPVPSDKVWRVNSSAVTAAINSASKDANGNITEDIVADGATIYSGYLYKTNNTVTYTHRGTSYEFKTSLQGGSGTESSKSIAIVPQESACTVTVVFSCGGTTEDKPRTQYIYFNGQQYGENSGYGYTASTVTADIPLADILAAEPNTPIYTWGGGSNKEVYAIFIDYYSDGDSKGVSGSVTNRSKIDLSGKNILFTNTADENETYKTAYGDTYSLNLPKGKTFNVSVEDCDEVCASDATRTLTVTSDKYNMAGANLVFVRSDGALEVTGSVSTISSHDLKTPVYGYDSTIGAELIFTKNGETTPFATAEVEADGTYSAMLIADTEYSVSLATAEGKSYSLSPLSQSYQFGTSEETPFKNILLMKDVESTLAYKDTLTVGADKEYPSISEAIAAVRLMTRENNEPVTIVVDPGTYQEQLNIELSNIILKAADENNKPMVQWYYGIGYVYYSAGADGWYNADDAVQKTEQRTVSNWGATLRTTSAVKGFRAENINFQSTFNKFIVQQELDDGVTSGGGSANSFKRNKLGIEVRAKEGATERAAAIYAQGREIELYRCSFSSSQDTFGTGAVSMYVKECDIAGNTDYICGGNNCYFEDCNLIWTGYSDKATGGYITACKTSAEPPADLGYYFKNCTIKNSNESGMKFAAGSWGRSWGGYNCQVIFDNTTLSGVSKPGKWIAMGKVDGVAVPVSKIGLYVINGVNGTDYSSNTDDNPHGPLAADKVPEPEDFFGDWTPVHFVSESSKIRINTESNVAGCSVSVPSRSVEGETVTVSATASNKNYAIDTITVRKTASGEAVELSANNTFVMPAEEVTVSATFKKVSFADTDFADWYIGEQSSGSGDGAADVVEYNGETALNITAKNVYLPLAAPVSSGTATFDFDIYIDTTVDRNFRVYLENENGTWQNTGNVMAEVINNRGSQVNSGPDIDSKTNPLFTYAELGASGWVKFRITLDYSKSTTNEFITITAAKADGTSLGTKSMGVISGKSTALKSIRFVTTAAPSHYANVSFSSAAE